MPGHTRWVTHVAVSPDGRPAVSASADKTLKVWDLNSGTELATLTRHFSGVGAMAVAPDRGRAVSGVPQRNAEGMGP